MRKKIYNLAGRANKSFIIDKSKSKTKIYKIKTTNQSEIITHNSNEVTEINIEPYLNNGKYNIYLSEKRKLELKNKMNIHLVYPKIVNQLYKSLPENS